MVVLQMVVGVAQQPPGLQVRMFWVMGVQVCACQRLFVVYTWR